MALTKPIRRPSPIRFLNPDNIFSQLDIEEKMTIADLGCGSGFMTIKAAQLVGENGTVYAVDIQKGVISEINSKIKLFNLRNIKPIWANLENVGSTEISESSVDLSLLVHILHQSKIRPEVIKEAKRITKPKGKILVVDWQKGKTMLGTPEKTRASKETLLKEAEAQGLRFLKDIKTDPSHYGFLMENG